MFIRLYEAPDDSGTPAAPAKDDYLGMIGGDQPDGADLIMKAIRDGNADTDTPPETPEDPAAEPPAEPELLLGRFKSKDDVVQAYQNLEPEFTQTRQQMREYERQVQELQQQLQQQQQPQTQPFEFDSPYNENPTSIEELEALAERDPSKAALWAIGNSANLPGELVQETVNYWHQRNPAQATAYMFQQMMQSYMPQIDQRLAPVENSHTENLVQAAVNAAETTIGPNYGQYHDRIIDALEANPTMLPDDPSNIQSMHDSIVRVYAMLLGQDMLAKGAQAAQGATDPGQQQPSEPPNLATTATRTTASAPSVTPIDADEDAIAKQIQDMILNSRG